MYNIVNQYCLDDIQCKVIMKHWLYSLCCTSLYLIYFILCSLYVLMLFTYFAKSPLPRGFPGGSEGKESACKAVDLGSIPGWGRSPGEGNGYPLQYSCWRIPWTYSLMVYNPWDHKELDTTEWLTLLYYLFYPSLYPLLSVHQ